MISQGNDYIVDSGAAIFIHQNCETTTSTSCFIECANGSKERAFFCEPPALFSEDGKQVEFGDTDKNCFSQTIGHNIFSLKHAIDLGYRIDPKFTKLKTPTGGEIDIHRNSDGLFYIRLYEQQESRANSLKFRALVSRVEKQYSDRRIVSEHIRLGHQTPLPERLKRFCKPCCEGKGVRKTKHSGQYQKVRVQGSAWADIGGPFPKDYGKFRYFLVIVRFDGESAVFFPETKAQAYLHLNDFMLKNHDIDRLRTDNGGEFVSKKFREVCAQHKVDLSFTSPYHPEENSIAENGVKRLCGNTRVMMLDSECPADKWPLAMMYSNYLSNRLGRQSLGGDSPYFRRRGEKADLSNCRRFGEKVFYRLRPEQRRSKLTERFAPAVYVGQCEESCDSLLLSEEDYQKPGFRKTDIIRSSELKFSSPSANPFRDSPELHQLEEERVFFVKETAGSVSGNMAAIFGALLQFWLFLTLCLTPVSGEKFAKTAPEKYQHFKNFIAFKRTRAGVGTGVNRTQRRVEWKQFKKKERKFHRKEFKNYTEFRCRKHLLMTRTLPEDYNFVDYGEELFEFLEDPHFPCFATKVKITSTLFEDDRWEAALRKEYDAFVRQDCFAKVRSLPAGVKAIPMALLGELKENDRCKIRSIVLGNKQAMQEAEDNFAPVVNHQTIKLTLQHALDCGHELLSFDISEAFLYGELSEDQVCYVTPPKQFRKFDPETKFWKLKKSIYGLRCAPLCWHRQYVRRAKALGWAQSETDPCLFSRGSCRKVVYVDDVLISGPKLEAERARRELLEYFPGRVQDCSQDGTLTFLGMKVRYVQNQLCAISNPTQIAKLLEKLGGGEIGAKTPLFTRPLHQKEETDIIDSHDYRSVVGSLNYISCISRPDLAYCVQFLSRVLDKPGTGELHMAKRAMRYVRCTAERELVLHKSNFNQQCPSSVIKHVKCFSDADFNQEGKSSTGINITVAGTPVHWRSTRQRLSTTSTAEAEYVACAQLVKEVTYFSMLLSDIYAFPLKPHEDQEKFEIAITPPTPYDCFVDNQAALRMAEHSHNTPRTKHMLVRFGYIRSAIEAGLVRLEYVASALNLADQFTKAMSRDKLDELFGV